MSPIVVVDSGSYTAPAPGSPTSTGQAVLDDAWNHLYSVIRPEEDKLATAMNSSVESVVNTYQRGGIKAGAKLSIDIEDIRVWSQSTVTSTVRRGANGSTAAAHAAGSVIYVNAEFTPWEIFKATNNELKSLSSPLAGLFAVRTVTLVYNPSHVGYDLTGVTNIDGILRVLQETTGSDRTRIPVTDWRVERGLDTDVFPSGYGLFLTRGWSGKDVFVSYRGQFSELSALDNDVETVTGLPYSCHDILAMGAALRCAAPAEIDRNQMGSQGSGRRSSEVPAGARLNAVRGLAQLRQQRISEERSRLLRRFPVQLPKRF